MRFVPAILLSCTLLMGFNQYTKTSLVCYAATPPHGHGFGNFLENACYLSERYYEMMESGSLKPFKHRNLYLWFPIILILQTASLCLVKVVWVFIGNHTNYSYILQLANELSGKESLEKLTNRLWKLFPPATSCGYPKFLLGYLLTKMISLIIIMGNLTFLYVFIFLTDYQYPYQILKSLIFDDSKLDDANSMFQSIVLCKVGLFHISSNNRITAQCLLTWNVFYSKIFSIITGLLLLCVLLILCDLVKWFIYLLLKERILLGYLMKKNEMLPHRRESMVAFVKTITIDLYFLLIMISLNVNNIIAHELVNEMFSKYINSIAKVNKDDDDYVIVV